MSDKILLLKKEYHWAHVILAYALIVIGYHWDVLANFSSSVLAGSQVGGVIAWEGWWFRLSLLTKPDLNPFFSPMIMHPVGTPVFFHSPLATLFFLTFHGLLTPYETTNLFSMVGFIGAGFSMYLLVYEWTRHRWASFLSGYFFMFSQDGLTQHLLGHFGQANVFFVPLFVLGVLKFMKDPSSL